MVHSTPKRPRARKQGKPKPKSGDGPLTKLPDELLLKIMGQAGTPELLVLRLTCKTLEPSANSVISKRFDRLYIHPSPKKLENALSICDHPFSDNVKEVVLLGQPQWRKIEEACPVYRPRPHEERMMMYNTYPDWQSDFRTWPAVIESAGSKEPEEHGETDCSNPWCSCSKTKQQPAFAAAYRPLITALAKLPKLSSLHFLESVDRHGLNQVSAKDIETHACQYIDPASNSDPLRPLSKTQAKKLARKVEGRLTAEAQGEFRFPDAVVFYGLLFDPRLPFTSTYIGTELPFTDAVTKHVIRIPGNISNASLPGGLRELDISLDCGWPCNAQHNWYRDLLVANRCTLENLRINFNPNASVKQVRMDTQLVVLFQNDLLMPKLKSLNIRLRASTSRLDKKGRWTRPVRPNAQLYNFPAFIRRHSASLSQVSFINVLFGDDASTLPPLSISSGLTLKELQECPKLERATYIVNRYTHDPRCKRHDDEDMSDCAKFNCGRYSGDDGLYEFEHLAEKLGLEVKKQGFWSFGDMVMGFEKE